MTRDEEMRQLRQAIATHQREHAERMRKLNGLNEELRQRAAFATHRRDQVEAALRDEIARHRERFSGTEGRHGA